MNISFAPRLLHPTADELLARVAELVPVLQRNAGDADRDAAFPSADLERLREAGCLAAPVQTRLGGLGLGTEPAGAVWLARLLRLLGLGNLSLGRIFEAHVNALRLISLYGNDSQRWAAADAAKAGHLFGLWVTDAADPLVVIGAAGAQRLRGGKAFCSAAGHVTRALVTARLPDGSAQMLLVPIERSRQPAGGRPPSGMRATATANMDLDGIAILPQAVIGGPNDYVREPEFSAGAWRTCATLLGGLDALVAEARRQLTARGRADNPHQRARMGQALIAQETAALWVRRAADFGDAPTVSARLRHAYVNLTRIAVERACLDAMQLVQRSLGLAAFLPPNPVERLCRDLATYLRQPAPDEALDDAAAWFMDHPLPETDEAQA